jgi:hypothetical protein
MKDSMDKDQQIARELGRYRLAPPSADLRDRILRAAREELARGSAELHWTNRWLQMCAAFRQEILAFASSLLLILGLIAQLGGSQSALAGSIERWTVKAALSGSLYRVISMDCTVIKHGAGDEGQKYRVRWTKAGITRVDMASGSGAEQTLWISERAVYIADHGGGPARSTAIAAMPPNWELPQEFLAPVLLAKNLERYWLVPAGRRNQVVPNAFLLVGKNGQQGFEIAIDPKTFLPKTLKKNPSDSTYANNERDNLEEAWFQWNKPIQRELLVPKLPQSNKRGN